jgi:hypothetical protein
MMFKNEIQKIAEALGIEGDFLVDFGFDQIMNCIATNNDVINRADVMLNVASRFIRENRLEEYEIFYDGAMCDGNCVADECLFAADMLVGHCI